MDQYEVRVYIFIVEKHGFFGNDLAVSLSTSCPPPSELY